MFHLKTVVCLLAFPASAAAQSMTVDIPFVFNVPGHASAAPSPAWRFAPLPPLQPGKPLEEAARLRIDLRPRPADVAGLRREQPTTQRRPAAIEYSRGYEIRQRIHVVASLATLPLSPPSW